MRRLIYLAALIIAGGVNIAAGQTVKNNGDRHVTCTQIGSSLILGGNQELGIRLFSGFAGVTALKFAGVEAGLRFGINLFKSYKSGTFILEGTGAWYAGAIIGCVSKRDYQTLIPDEFRFAGSGITAKIQGLTWGIGGIGMLTTRYKTKNISNYLGTQYLKGNLGNVNFTFNHSNDAMMGGFWLKKCLPPIWGFYNTDWDRTTELSVTVNVMDPKYVLSGYGKVSLFTPSIAIDNLNNREIIQTGQTRMRNGQLQPQSQYVLNPDSHGTFFSFAQLGFTGVWKSGSANLNYSWGNPQPVVQNDFAHDHGYRFPIFMPDPGMSPNQSRAGLGAGYSFTSVIK